MMSLSGTSISSTNSIGNARILHGVGLGNGARKTVEQITVLAVILGQAILDHADDDSVRHQAAGVHVLFGFKAQRACRP
jgi:hypothetical protein